MNSWETLKAEAGRVVETTLAELPPEIRTEAEKVPVLFEEACDEDPEIMGTYGHFEPGEMSVANGPIVLYLLTLEDYCLDEESDFAEEVRVTYLHELGHHFGWDEEDLEERGLG